MDSNRKAMPSFDPTNAASGVGAPPVLPLQSSENKPQGTRFAARLMVVGTVIIFCLICNTALPSLFWNRRTLGTWNVEFAFAAIGGLASQIALLSVWCALGPQSFQWRFLATSLLAVLVGSSYIIGLQIPDYPNSDMPVWVGIFILAVGVAAFLLSTVAVRGLAWLTGERIVDSDKSLPYSNLSQSYSIGYLIGLTTAVAAIVAMIRGSMPEADGNRPPTQEIVTIVLLMLQHTFFTILLLFSSITLILRSEKNLHGLVWLVLLLTAALPANLMLMSQYRTVQLNGEIVACLIFYTVGFLAAVTIQLFLIRLLGYRLKTVRS